MSEFRKRSGKEQEKNEAATQATSGVTHETNEPETTGSNTTTGYSHDEYDDYAPWDN